MPCFSKGYLVDLSWDQSAKTSINQALSSLYWMHTYCLLISERYFLKTHSSPVRFSFLLLCCYPGKKNSRIHGIINQVLNMCKAQLYTWLNRFLIYSMWVNKQAARIKQCALNRCSHSVSQSVFYCRTQADWDHGWTRTVCTKTCSVLHGSCDDIINWLGDWKLCNHPLLCYFNCGLVYVPPSLAPPFFFLNTGIHCCLIQAWSRTIHHCVCPGGKNRFIRSDEAQILVLKGKSWI